MELHTASRQWSSRPDDERFVNLDIMRAQAELERARSREVVVSTRKLEVRPVDDTKEKGIEVFGPNGTGYAPTNWAFGQLAELAEAPAGYLRTLPASLVADCVNYGLQLKCKEKDVGILLQKNGSSILRAVTGPRYGRVWNAQMLDAVINIFGNGVDGKFRVPGVWGQRVDVTKENTTLYMGDRSIFLFLTDETNKITLPNRRNGQPGQLSRGFFLWGSEVGASSLGVATFLFDEVCANRIVWGACDFSEIRMRHTFGISARWEEEVVPALRDLSKDLDAYAASSTFSIEAALKRAQETKLGDKLNEFVVARFGKKNAERIALAHQTDEGRPMETIWDVVTGATAYAREIPWQEQRVDFERKAGELLAIAA